MTDIYDDLDRHLAAAPDIGQASVPMGMLLAWCARHHLLSAAINSEHERLLLRLRMEEARGSELLTACGGTLRKDMFNPAGQAFMDRFYAAYLDEYAECFGGDPYLVEESWANYQKIAGRISAAFHQRAAGRSLSQRVKTGWRKLLGRER